MGCSLLSIVEVIHFLYNGCENFWRSRKALNKSKISCNGQWVKPVKMKVPPRGLNLEREMKEVKNDVSELKKDISEIKYLLKRNCQEPSVSKTLKN
jgi:DNA-binding transcriptional regulator GbsR (MarR family)